MKIKRAKIWVQHISPRKERYKLGIDGISVF